MQGTRVVPTVSDTVTRNYRSSIFAASIYYRI